MSSPVRDECTLGRRPQHVTAYNGITLRAHRIQLLRRHSKGHTPFFPLMKKPSNSRTGVFCLLHSLAFVLVRGCCALYLTACHTPRFTPHTYTCVSPHSVTHTKPRAYQGSSRGRSGGGPEPLPRRVYSACCTDPRASRLGWDGWMRFPSLWCLCVLRDVTALPGTSGKCISAQGRKP